MSIFSSNEINTRRSRLIEASEECDAFALFSFTNSYYFSGAPIIPWGRPAITLVGRDGSSALIVAAGEEARAIRHAHIGTLHTYGDDDGPSINEALRILSELIRQGRTISRLGYDGNATPAATINELRRALPQLEFRDVSPLTDEIRTRLTSEELVYSRMATEIADIGVTTYLREARIGVREVAVAAKTMLAMSEFAAEKYPDAEVRVNCYSQQGVRSLQPHTAANGEPITSGQLMQVVVEAHVWNYLAAVERTLALGELDTEQTRLYNAIIAAQDAAIAAVRPGELCSMIDEAARNVFREAGFQTFNCGSGLARGILTEWEGRIDRTNLRKYNKNLLQAGMVMTVEPFAFVEGVGAPRHCDMILVTESGSEKISKAQAGWLQIS